MIDELERRIGRRTLGNVVASGTEIIDRLGAEHLRTGFPIVYTSADSVLQIAAHEATVPIDDLYRMCEAAFEIACQGLGVGRVIARPFEGRPGAFRRTVRRHDYALEPTGPTLLDALTAAGHEVVSIGKVNDLFAGRGISRSQPTISDADGMARVSAELGTMTGGLLFVNLVDSDTQHGHRNDPAGYARNLESIDQWVGTVLPALGARRSVRPHRRPRQRPHDPEHRSLPRARAGAPRRPPRASRRRHRRASDVRRPGADNRR